MLGLMVVCACTERASPPPAPVAPRLVSLSPAITEVLFSIGAGDQVVGISNYCDFPPEAIRLPRAGTALTPAYEALAGLRPTRIISERTLNSREQELAAIAPTELLSWHSLDDIVESTRKLGQWTGHQDRAEELARRLKETLSRRAPPNAPRVLLVIGGTQELSSIWYMKPNSLHGAALEAAGARNIIETPSSGPPNLSMERVIELNPDAILVLVSGELDEAARQSYLDAWKKLSTLKAVRCDAVRIISGKGVQSVGPRILELVERLRQELPSVPCAK
ncbi:ABC transporter substrate-binding protein [Hyalangium versicolor]|uniref:ABC transporter substrate-binding protein n=1 Tax=Hyalangium versicolor TaxID=2861190 RepID=UPI001CCF2427|nr:ABC transporter substrate-binding protein [Hyalangium versicolor]